MKHTLYYISILTIFGLSAQDISDLRQDPIIIVVPGQDAKGGQQLARSLFNRIDFLSGTPDKVSESGQVDFGQANCQNHLHVTMSQAMAQAKSEGRKIIIVAASQGVGTTINYMAHHPEVSDYLEGMITEGGLLSANSALFHGSRRSAFAPMTKLLGSSYWGPYVAKFVRFPGYAVAGEQPIDHIKQFPRNAWVIVAHDPKDYTVPFCNAQAFVGGLLAQRHAQDPHVALIPVRNKIPCHINIITNGNNIAEHNETTYTGAEVYNVDNSYTQQIKELIASWRQGKMHHDESIQSYTLPDTCLQEYHKLMQYEYRVRTYVPLTMVMLAQLFVLKAGS